MVVQSKSQTWKTELKKLAPGAYAYIQEVGKGPFPPPPTVRGVSTAGLIVGKQGATVIDTLNTPSQARAFIKEIQTVTAVPIQHIIITHSHGDHYHGNQFFPGAEIVCQDRCREHIVAGGADAPQRYARNRPQWAEEMKEVKIVLPTVTFDSKFTLHDGDREIEFLHKGPAHTDNDVVVFLRKERVLYASDLAFFHCSPQASAGNIKNWLKIIDDILKMPVDHIVPGHGPLGTIEDMAPQRAYFVNLLQEASRCYKSGYTAEEAVKRVDLGAYKDWPDFETSLALNVKGVYRDLDLEAGIPVK